MVIVKTSISACEHHLLPFFSVVAYIPSNRVIGLSKFRPGRLQSSASGAGRLTGQIGAIHEKIAPLGVAVVMEATISVCRCGVERQNSCAVTSAMLGTFRDVARTRMEFLELLQRACAESWARDVGEPMYRRG